jgi:CheY-like chemotaxis protein
MKAIHILLVEDNEGDILLTTEALSEGRISNAVDVVKDGWEAIKYLEKRDDYAQSKTPDLILLDINLPKMSGHEVLKYIKENDAFKHLPVIMLTTSSSEDDILKSYKQYCNCFITKPIGASEFVNVVSKLEEFWISIVQLPPAQNKQI